MDSIFSFSDSDKSDFEGFDVDDVANAEAAKRLSEGNIEVVPDSVDSVQSIDIDLDSSESDNLVDDSQSDSDSQPAYRNDVQNLLDDLENLSDPDTSSSENDNSGSDDEIPNGMQPPDNNDNNLCIDVDNLEGDPRNGDEMFDLLNCDPEWTENFNPIHVKQFNGPIGANLPPSFDCSTATPLDYFQLFMTPDIWEKIAENTNKYEKYVTAQKRITKPDYVEKHWNGIDVPLLKAYHGICIIMGILGGRRYKSFWSTDPYLTNIGISNVMPCRMYTKICEFLHISSREDEHPRGHPEYDKLGKIRWFIDELNRKFATLYHVEKCVSLDEAIVGFSGRCKFLQWNPAKPVKRGIKLFVACSAESCFCYKFQVYLGKGSSTVSKNGLYFDVVWDLVKDLQGRNHTIYFDNLYGSIATLRFLYSKGLYSTATVRKGRKNLPPIFKKPPKMNRGDHRTFQSSRLSNLTATVWSDTKEVSFISTASQPHIISKTHRRIAHRHVEVTIPAVAKQYGKNYSGVDKLDHLTSKKIYGGVSHSSRKVWKHLYFYFINLICAQSWILYQKTSTREQPKNYDHMAFRLELAKQLCSFHCSRKRASTIKSNIDANVVATFGGHQLVHMKARRSKRCVSHSRLRPNNKPRYESAYGCLQCGSHYCVDCFRITHCKP